MIPKLWSKLGSAGEITSPCIGAAGTVLGSPTYPASKFGNGILSNVDGEGCYFPTAANTINHNKGTIECWSKINFAPTDAGYHYLWCFMQWQAGYGGIEIRFDPSVDKFVISVCKDEAIQVTINSGAFSWSAGTLAHFAVTWDRTGAAIGGGKTLSLRINNVEYASSTTTWATTTVRANLWVGSRENGSLHSDMVIDNLKTYDGCITNFTDRNYECCAPPTGCTAHYVATDKSYCTWADNSISEQGFRVEYRIDGGGWTYYQNVGAGVTQSSTKTVGANHKIAWQVRAYIGTGYTGFSISGDVYTTPAAPSGCIAHYKATNLAYCTWADDSAYEDGFTIEYSINSGVDWVFFENVGANVEQSSDKDVSGLEKIRFRVRAYKGALVSAWSESSDLYLIPAAPTNCVASYVATDQSKCTWTDNSTNETGFRIEVDIDDAGFTLWKNVGENVEDSGNHSTGANKKIRFRVRAYSAAGDSDWATSGYVYTTPAAPSGCSISPGTIAVSWNDNSAYEDGFKIERQIDDGGWNIVQTVDPNIESWDDTDHPISPNEKYQYRVRAYIGSLYSAYSTSNIIYMKYKVFTETLILSDTLRKKVGKVFTESIGLTDTFSKVWHIHRTFTETLHLTDVFSKVLSYHRTFTETLHLTDVFSRVLNYYRTFTEKINLVDKVKVAKVNLVNLIKKLLHLEDIED